MIEPQRTEPALCHCILSVVAKHIVLVERSVVGDRGRKRVVGLCPGQRSKEGEHVGQHVVDMRKVNARL